MAEDSNAACRAQNSSQHPDPLRPSELFGLTWDSYQGNVFVIVNTAWRARLQRKKIKRKNRFGDQLWLGRDSRGGGLGPSNSGGRNVWALPMP